MSAVLDNRVAVITGGARGIGLAIAQTMVMHGAKVMIADNGCALDGSPEDSVVTEAAVARCNALAPGSAAGFAEDLAAHGAAERLVQACRQQWGAVDIVVNNAAVARDGPVTALSREAFDYVLANNLSAPFALTAAAAPAMLAQIGEGRIPGAIINMLGAAGVYGEAGQAAMSAAKAGLLGLTRATAHDLMRTGITCNAVLPFAESRATRARAARDADEGHYLQGLWAIPPSYAANLVTWLASPQAASVTGQLLAVRGRETVLFSQARPQHVIFTGAGVLDADALGYSFFEQFSVQFTPLDREHQAFGADPVL